MAKLTSLQTISSNEVTLEDGLYLAHKTNDNPETYEDKRINIDELAGALPTEDIKYNNTESGLTATDVQGAIDELAAGGREVLNDLTDVTITNPAANQLLQYNATTEQWENKQYIIPTELGELSDVNIASTPEDGQVLSYDATSDKWVAGAPGSSGVELTQAEYDALEQAGELEENVQYFITDANGDGSQFQPVIFSTTEREIGVWVDGKPLYEKTIITNSSVTNADVDVDISNLNVDIIIYIGGEYSRKVNNLELYYPWGENEYNTGDEIVFGSYCRFYKTNDSITYKIIHKDNSTTDYQRFTIQYTKSTDTAGNGTWTPQGVPAVHYSTDERIVGTWIDGSPVYEIVLETDTQVQLNNTSWTTIPWNNEPSDIDLLISAEIVRMCPNTNSTMRFTLDSGHIKGASLSSNNYPAVSNVTERLIIRYTKSST